MRLNVRLKGITLPVKGAILAFNSLGDASPGARRLHRPRRVRPIASPHFPRDLGLFWGNVQPSGSVIFFESDWWLSDNETDPLEHANVA
jgi:hypothetical protein